MTAKIHPISDDVIEELERAKTRDIVEWLREKQDAYLNRQNLMAAIRHGRAADEIDSLLLSLKQARAEVERVRELEAVIERAAQQFEFYRDQHMAKTPPDTAKADTNAGMALLLRRSLLTPTGGRDG